MLPLFAHSCLIWLTVLPLFAHSCLILLTVLPLFTHSVISVYSLLPHLAHCGGAGWLTGDKAHQAELHFQNGMECLTRVKLAPTQRPANSPLQHQAEQRFAFNLAKLNGEAAPRGGAVLLHCPCLRRCLSRLYLVCISFASRLYLVCISCGARSLSLSAPMLWQVIGHFPLGCTHSRPHIRGLSYRRTHSCCRCQNPSQSHHAPQPRHTLSPLTLVTLLTTRCQTPLTLINLITLLNFVTRSSHLLSSPYSPPSPSSSPPSAKLLSRHSQLSVLSPGYRHRKKRRDG